MTNIPTAIRDAAALFAGEEFPCLWLDAGFMVTTDRAQMFVTRIDYDGPGIALPLDIGEQLTIMDGVVMSEAGIHMPLSVEFPAWRRAYRTAQSGAEGVYCGDLMHRVLRANDLLGGGKVAVQTSGRSAARCVIGGGVAQVLWMPMSWGEIEVWDV